MQISKKTKIIATIGPSSESAQNISDLINAGVNVFRFNTKHNTIDWHAQRITLVKKISDDLKTPVGILVDLQGPEIRIETYESKPIEVKKGNFIEFVKEFDANPSLLSSIKIPVSKIIDSLNVEDAFSIDDGFFEFVITEKNKNSVIAKCFDDGLIGNRKSLNLIGKDIDLPSLTDDDLNKLDIAAKSNVDFIALSFVRTAQDIIILRNEMQKRGLKARIVAKIESQKGVDNIDEIIETADAIMIARGDLGVELPIERIAYIQKQIIKKCRAKNKQVIVATQMLQSMTEHSRPTRAEASDVANAVYDGADAVMLSAESATGKHPLKAVEIMKRILKFNEDHSLVNIEVHKKAENQTAALVKAAINLIEEKAINIHKVIIFTETGFTGHVFSSFRCKIPGLAVSNRKEVVESLTLDYGIHPVYTVFPTGDFSFYDMDNLLIDRGYIKKGETVLVIHGNKWNDPGKTNAIVVVEV